MIEKLVVTQVRLIIAVALYLVVFCNVAFFSHVIHIYPLSYSNIGFLFSLSVVLFCSIVLLLTVISSKYTTKPALITIVVASSIAAYFMDSYGAVIDNTMLQNVFETDINEAAGLFSINLILYVVFLGLTPAFFIYKSRIRRDSIFKELIRKAASVAACLVISLGMFAAFSDSYASFIREHKPLRYYTNPTYFIYSGAKYLAQTVEANEPTEISKLGEDASIPEADPDRELVIMVVGETARADRFSVNGYERVTNPFLEKEDIISFEHFASCGTSTAVSVPCMFSVYTHDNYDGNKADHTENVLDILSHADVGILWRDNNSGSKRVATRVAYENFSIPENNPECDVECRDIGMLSGLQGYIDNMHTKDILIVLHQMGNHGPEYYKRYPDEFERFKPVCRTSELKNCSTEEINHAYDNAILYTDYFLSNVIDLLKQNSDEFETAMLYVSDHGESLGEHGLYLHGMPYMIAPEEQTHVPAILWLGTSFHVDRSLVRAGSDRNYNHDNVFYTLLDLFEIETDLYDADKSLLGIPG